MAERGYYAFSVKMVKGVLEDQGAGPARQCSLFGADAVLYVTIETWTAEYMLFNTQVTVEFDYVMKDGKTGETIRADHERIFEDSSQGARDPITPLVMAIIAKAYPNYARLARSANSHAF